MIVNEITRRGLAIARQARELKRRGYEQITCKFGVGDLWQLDRGCRIGWKLTDAIVGVDGLSVWVKAEPNA